MATATKTLTDARARSIELATAKGHTPCSHAAKTLGWHLDERDQLVSLALEIHSAHDETRYAVGYLASADDASCDCQAAQYGRPCWHRGLAIICGRDVARIYATHEDCWR
ncbi:MAG TPA: SWIM zinc finger family protein [Ktedonobacterales bacterium]|jgi:hypothetical protein|nr:SWIM zinc finger family protein [Ktedonobacterales bacterium]